MMDNVILDVFFFLFNPTEVPDPPHSLTIDSKSSRVVIISWTADLYGIRASENYTVEISQYNQNFMDAVCQGSLSSNACVVSSYATKASLTGLLPWTTYNIRVFATNEIGKSNSSHILTVTTDEEGKCMLFTSAFLCRVWKEPHG